MPIMSNNIGKKVIKLPSNIKISLLQYPSFNSLIFNKDDTFKELKFPLNYQILLNLHELKINKIDNIKDNGEWGLLRSQIANIIIGLHQGFSKKLILKGVGFRFQDTQINNQILLYIGYTNPITIKLPNTIKYKIINNNILEGKCDNLQELTNNFNKIRILKPADKDHYKGKGIIIED